MIYGNAYEEELDDKKQKRLLQPVNRSKNNLELGALFYMGGVSYLERNNSTPELLIKIRLAL